MKKLSILLSLILIVSISNAQWTTSGNDIYNTNTGNVGVGTSAPPARLSVLQPVTTNVVSSLALFGYSNTATNRSIAIQQIGNTSTVHQYIFLNGGLGSGSALGSPTLSSVYAPSFGFECNDNNLNILTASSGTNVTPSIAMSFSPNGNVGIGTTSPGSFKLAVE